MNGKTKITFVSHDSSLTGGPILLLNLLKLLILQDQYVITILLYRGGRLEDEFRKIAPTFVLKGSKYNKQRNIVLRTVNYLEFRIRKARFMKQVKDADLIFMNTIAVGILAKAFHRLHIPLVVYVHELPSVIEILNKKGHVDLALQSARFLAVPSQAVADNLVSHHRIASSKIITLDYYFPKPGEPSSSKAAMRDSFCNAFGIPKDKFFVVGMGTATKRKGIDIFLDCCYEAARLDRDIFFVWIGDFEDPQTKEASMTKITQSGMDKYVKLTGSIPHSPFTLFPFDLFVLTSREDPYPLVIIEAAYVRLPAICFQGSGGAAEFVAPDCGWTVPDFSALAMAKKIVELKHAPDQLLTFGINAFDRAMEWHGDEALISGQFKNILDRALEIA